MQLQQAVTRSPSGVAIRNSRGACLIPLKSFPSTGWGSLSGLAVLSICERIEEPDLPKLSPDRDVRSWALCCLFVSEMLTAPWFCLPFPAVLAPIVAAQSSRKACMDGRGKG